jgi:hypothetical protein
MKKLNKIEITEAEQNALKAAQMVSENIWRRFKEANPDIWGERLSMRMEIKEALDNEPHAWWHVYPESDMNQSGHCMTLAAALAEMHGHTEAGVKRQQAKRLKEGAERLEREARELEEPLNDKLRRGGPPPLPPASGSAAEITENPSKTA